MYVYIIYSLNPNLIFIQSMVLKNIYIYNILTTTTTNNNNNNINNKKKKKKKKKNYRGKSKGSA